MDKRILFIGGSPCSGKSTVAERISNEYGAYYFKVDDFLQKFIVMGAKKEYPTCKHIADMSYNEIWMRDPLIQCEEEFRIYEEISEFIFDYLEKIDADFIITEGAAFTPGIMKKYSPKYYVSLVPTPEFQIYHYKKREWIKYVLKDCSNKDIAFDNWMNRDILFAKQVKAECDDDGFVCIINDGKKSEDEMYCIIKKYLNLV